MENSGSKRMKTSEDSEEIVMSKLSGKERAKIHRDRKKKYYENLEIENKKLNLKVKELTEEINSLKQQRESEPSTSAFREWRSDAGSCISSQGYPKLPQISKLLKLRNEEEFRYKSLPRLLKDNPELVKYSLIEQTKQSIGPNGKNRISYLKDQFDNILDNVLPLESKCSLVVFEHLSISKWARVVSSNPQKFANKSVTGEKVLDDLLRTKISAGLVNFVKQHGQKYHKIVQSIRKLMQKLVSTRNKILYYLNKHEELDIETGAYIDFPQDKEDTIQISDAVIEMKEKGLLNKFKVWGIKKKQDPNAPYTSEAELSE